jgi:hypothetical protein
MMPLAIAGLRPVIHKENALFFLQRLVRLTGFDPCRCPKCKTGTLQVTELLPRIRSPDNVFYNRKTDQRH